MSTAVVGWSDGIRSGILTLQPFGGLAGGFGKRYFTTMTSMAITLAVVEVMAANTSFSVRLKP
jgi:hypothetical protein